MGRPDQPTRSRSARLGRQAASLGRPLARPPTWAGCLPGHPPGPAACHATRLGRSPARGRRSIPRFSRPLEHSLVWRPGRQIARSQARSPSIGSIGQQQARGMPCMMRRSGGLTCTSRRYNAAIKGDA
jgi:hypothetical protein